jgi:hypothetical protein
MQVTNDHARFALDALVREANSADFDDLFPVSFEIDEATIDQLLAEIGVR